MYSLNPSKWTRLRVTGSISLLMTGLWLSQFVVVKSALAEVIDWPEAVSRLSGERTKAETCVAFLKGYGSRAQISRGQLDYGKAKSEIDSVISGLIVALTEGKKPEKLANLQTKLEHGALRLAEFCGGVNALLPDTAGQKKVIVEIVQAAIEPLIKALSDGISAIYNNYRQDNALIRKTIQTQLEAAKWPDFVAIKPIQ